MGMETRWHRIRRKKALGRAVLRLVSRLTAFTFNALSLVGTKWNHLMQLAAANVAPPGHHHAPLRLRTLFFSYIE